MFIAPWSGSLKLEAPILGTNYSTDTRPTGRTELPSAINPLHFHLHLSTMKVAAALVFTASTVAAFAPATFGVRCTL